MTCMAMDRILRPNRVKATSTCAKWSQTGGPERVDTPAAEHGPALGARRNTVAAIAVAAIAVAPITEVFGCCSDHSGVSPLGS